MCFTGLSDVCVFCFGIGRNARLTFGVPARRSFPTLRQSLKSAVAEGDVQLLEEAIKEGRKTLLEEEDDDGMRFLCPEVRASMRSMQQAGTRRVPPDILSLHWCLSI